MVAILVLLYGLVVGSFLNVCAYRIPHKQSIISPGSHCPHCKKPINFYDNVPVLSYLLLRGKCRYCRNPIHFRYPLVELTTGLLFLSTYLVIGLQWLLLPALFFISFLIVVLLIDLDHQIIPNGLVIFGLVAGIIFLITNQFFDFQFPLLTSVYKPLLSTMGSGLSASLCLLVVAYTGQAIFKKEAMGGGDIKLAAVLGIFLGPYVFLGLLLAFFVGAVVSIMLLSSGLVKRKQPIAFGPFMAIGAVLTLYFGPQIWHWYATLALGY